MQTTSLKHAVSVFRTEKASKPEIKCENRVKTFYLQHLKQNDLSFHSVWFLFYVFIYRRIETKSK